MSRFVFGAAVATIMAISLPAFADGYWHNGHWHSCWNCNGIGPGAAVALGLGAAAVGATLANPGWWGTPYYRPVVPYRPPMTCWNGLAWVWC
jgi:hypothetical protein